MQQTIQLNIIPFKPIQNEIEFSFYSKNQRDFAPIYWEHIVTERPADWLPEYRFFYSNFQQPEEGAVLKKIHLTQHIGFAQQYFNNLITNYFKSLPGVVVFHNFINDTEVWLKDESFQNKIYNLYQKYTIKVQYAKVTHGFELVVSYDGTSKIMKQNLADIHFSTELLTLVNCNGTIFSYEYMPLEFKQHMENVFPVVNNDLMPVLDIPFPEPIFQNRYPVFLKIISDFCNAYLKTEEFSKIINLDKKGFVNLNEGFVFKTSNQSNELLFGKGWNNPDYQTHVNPGAGMYSLGPHRLCPHPHVKFFFIYHKPDGKLIADTIHKYLKEGFVGEINNKEKKFKKMEWYIKQKFDMPKNLSLIFENEDTIFEEIEPQIKNFHKQENVKYVAIYITPFSKDHPDKNKHKVYYQLKETLLYEGITSQVIYKENLEKPTFYYFLPNIEIAMLAKIDGIPWRLNRVKSDEIIIGVGAFYSVTKKKRFVGSAFCFSNDGKFQDFDCFNSDETEMLAGSIRDAVNKFIEKNKNAKRVILHFYKVISNKRELEPILRMLGTLGTNDLPVIIVTINKTESKELLGFNMSHERRMPYSGTYVKVGYNQYLLFNNTFYFEDSTINNKEYHFPIKISIRSTKPELVEDVHTVRELIDQVYQFSRMYWKSVSQQNLPVTIKYPSMVAEIFPHFTYDKLPDFGKENLWFL